jgi:hypothetical protein
MKKASQILNKVLLHSHLTTGECYISPKMYDIPFWLTKHTGWVTAGDIQE